MFVLSLYLMYVNNDVFFCEKERLLRAPSTNVNLAQALRFLFYIHQTTIIIIIKMILFILRKEVIQPHLPVQLPCYDFVPVISPTLGICLPKGLAQWLQVLPTSMTWRAVCTRTGNVFNAVCWPAFTSNSTFMQANFSLQSQLRQVLSDWLPLAGWRPFVLAIVACV